VAGYGYCAVAQFNCCILFTPVSKSPL
jgi:hypothetical protein